MHMQYKGTDDAHPSPANPVGDPILLHGNPEALVAASRHGPDRVRPDASNLDRRDPGPSDLPRHELVYRVLREQLLAGAIVPDERLVEAVMARRFGVSRTPVREAFRRLMAENFLDGDRLRGVTVHRPGHGEIQDALGVREALDCLAAALAAHRISGVQVGKLHLVLRTMARRSGDHAGTVMAGLWFRDVMYGAADNRVLDSARLATERRWPRTADPAEDPARAREILAEHTALLCALERHDVANAVGACRAHVAAVRRCAVDSWLTWDSFAG